MYLTKLVGSFTILDWYMISVWTRFVLIAKLTWIAQEFGIHTLRFCPVAELPSRQCHYYHIEDLHLPALYGNSPARCQSARVDR